MILLRCFTTAVLAGAAALSTSPAMSPWETSLARGSVAADATGRMLFLDFRADWCGPCKAMEANVYTPSLMSDIASRAVPTRIDVEAQQEVARRYNVDTLPTIIFADAYGGELLRHTGSMDAKVLHDVLDALPSDMRAINTEAGRLRASSHDEQALLSLGRILRDDSLFAASLAYYLRALPQAKDERETVLNALAQDSLDLRQGNEAAKWFARCLKEFPGSARAPEWQAGLTSARKLPAA